MQVKIRDIKIEDVLPAFRQLEKLADFTDLTHMLVMTPESLKANLFNPNPDWFGLVAEMGTELAGMCLYSVINIHRSFHPTPAIHVDILFVEEKYRKNNIAKSLLGKVADIAKQKNFQRMELWCSKSNHTAQSAYAALGAEKIDMIDVLRFDTYSKLLPE